MRCPQPARFPGAVRHELHRRPRKSVAERVRASEISAGSRPSDWGRHRVTARADRGRRETASASPDGHHRASSKRSTARWLPFYASRPRSCAHARAAGSSRKVRTHNSCSCRARTARWCGARSTRSGRAVARRSSRRGPTTSSRQAGSYPSSRSSETRLGRRVHSGALPEMQIILPPQRCLT